MPKIKISEIKSKIKIREIKPEVKEEPSLEEEVEEITHSTGQIMRSRSVRAPVLEMQHGEQASPAQIRQAAAPEAEKEGERTRYEILNTGEEREVRQREYTPSTQRTGMVRPSLARQETSQIEQRAPLLRQQNQLASPGRFGEPDKKYEVKPETPGSKGRRKMPWEV